MSDAQRENLDRISVKLLRSQIPEEWYTDLLWLATVLDQQLKLTLGLTKDEIIEAQGREVTTLTLERDKYEGDINRLRVQINLIAKDGCITASKAREMTNMTTTDQRALWQEMYR